MSPMGPLNVSIKNNVFKDSHVDHDIAEGIKS